LEKEIFPFEESNISQNENIFNGFAQLADMYCWQKKQGRHLGGGHLPPLIWKNMDLFVFLHTIFFYILPPP